MNNAPTVTVTTYQNIVTVPGDRWRIDNDRLNVFLGDRMTFTASRSNWENVWFGGPHDAQVMRHAPARADNLPEPGA